MVLLKGVHLGGFVFYTDTRSPKGRALAKRPRAALTFYWPPLGRQVRMEGRTTRVSAKEADAYFRTRPRLSQIAAWASRQSGVLKSREELDRRVEAFKKKFEGGPVPRPPYWSGFRVKPSRVEFWQERSNRLHDRLLYMKKGSFWNLRRLFP
jgi:pyridoxamine 5'-phosphate oxidase